MINTALGAVGLGGSGGNLGTMYVRLAADSVQMIKGMEDGAKGVKYSAAAIVGALATIGAAAVHEFAKFDKAMTEAFSIMGDVSEDMKKQMSDVARTLARDSVKSAEDMAKSYFFLASAGFDAAQSMKALPLMTKFATAGNFEMAKATDYLADSQSALGLRAKDATENLENMARVADVLTKANILSNASVEQFAAALTNKAAAALRIVNKDVEEGVAVLAAFADQGLKGEAAGEALNIVLRDLQTAAIDNRAVFKELGVEVFDVNGKMNNMSRIVGQLEDVLKTASTEQQRMVFQLMGFQDRSLSATMSLIGVSGKIAEYEKALRSAGGTTEEVATKQMQSFSASIEVTVNRVKDLLITIGEGLRPALDQLNEMLRQTTALNSASNESWKETATIVGTVLVGAVKGAVMIWEGLRNVANLVAQLWLFNVEHIVRGFLGGIRLMETALNGFVDLFTTGLNVIIDRINDAISLLPDTIKDALDLKPFEHFAASKIEMPFQDSLEEWVETLRLARQELDERLVKSVVGAAKTVEPAIEVITLSIKEMGATVGGEIQKVEQQANKVKRLLDSMSAEAKLKEIGLPEQRFMGIDPLIGQSMDVNKEIEQAATRLAALEELGRKEVLLTEEVQKKKAEAVLQYTKRLKELQQAQSVLIVQSAQNAFNELATAACNFAGEQSDVYKAMFVASKAFAIAEAIIKIQQGIASAAALPWPTNLAAIASVVAATASIVSTISSVKLTLDGKKATGGGVRAGGNYLVGERGPELFSPASNGSIIPNERLGGGVKVVINNHTDANATVTERQEGDSRVIDVVIKRLKSEMASEIRDGRGDMARAMETSYGLRRGR